MKNKLIMIGALLQCMSLLSMQPGLELSTHLSSDPFVHRNDAADFADGKIAYIGRLQWNYLDYSQIFVDSVDEYIKNGLVVRNAAGDIDFTEKITREQEQVLRNQKWEHIYCKHRGKVRSFMTKFTQQRPAVFLRSYGEIKFLLHAITEYTSKYNESRDKIGNLEQQLSEGPGYTREEREQLAKMIIKVGATAVNFAFLQERFNVGMLYAPYGYPFHYINTMLKDYEWDQIKPLFLNNK
jgi:hypothetical protein